MRGNESKRGKKEGRQEGMLKKKIQCLFLFLRCPYSMHPICMCILYIHISLSLPVYLWYRPLIHGMLLSLHFCGKAMPFRLEPHRFPPGLELGARLFDHDDFILWIQHSGNLHRTFTYGYKYHIYIYIIYIYQIYIRYISDIYHIYIY